MLTGEERGEDIPRAIIEVQALSRLGALIT